MKKLLLSLACMLGLSSTTFAAEYYELVPNDATLSTSDTYLLVYPSSETSANVMGGYYTKGKYYESVTCAVANNTISVAEVTSQKAKPFMLEENTSGTDGAYSIKFIDDNKYITITSSSNNNLGNADSAGANSYVNITKNTAYVGAKNPANSWLINFTDQKGEFYLQNNDNRFSNYKNTTNNCQLYKLVSEELAKPTITMVDNEYNKVKIECETEGAEIHYTINGGAEQDYTAPFEITAASTIVAYASLEVDDDLKLSEETTATLYPNMVTSIADFYALESPKPVLINCDITAIAQGGSYMFVTDGTNPGIIYDSKNPQIVNGTTFDGITGTFKKVSGVKRITDPTFGTSSEGTAVEPTVATIADVTADNTGAFLRINGGNITTTDDKQMFTVGEESIQLYNNLGIKNVKDGDNYDVIGFASKYNSTLQFVPYQFAKNGVIVTDVATPTFSVESGTININSTVEISCATEGATIYYTIGDVTGEYDGPISLTEEGEVTITAYATKEGMYDSETATLNLSVVDPDKTEKVCYIDFSKQSWTQYSDNAKINWVSKDNMTFETTATAKANSGNTYYPRINGSSLRVYKSSKNIITVNAPKGYGFSSATLYTTQSPKITFNWTFKGVESTKDITPDNGTATITFPRAAEGEVLTFADGISSFSFNVNNTTNSSNNYEFSACELTIDKLEILTGVENIAIENVESGDAAVEYFNLQGVRVNNPQGGIFIIRQGNKASKVLR